ncbi:MAG: MotA/TolQ/ExbB proton channel family protein [Puniceicoccales bacterium]|jgi:biopolymer transport protein ExbB|nr:MotA/TolQ/ExbB proton channel family protein [Puniceicoccales bacterium]
MEIVDGLRMGGGFLWALVFLGLLSLLFFLERLLFLHKGNIRAESFVSGIKNLLRKERRLEALTLCQETPGPVARTVRLAILHSSGELRNLLQQNALLEVPLLCRRMRSLYVMSQVAPLIGFAGTTFCFLKGFLAMRTIGVYASVTTFSPFVISALSLTFWSVILAGTDLLLYHFLHGRLRSLMFDIEWAATAMVQFFEENPEK